MRTLTSSALAVALLVPVARLSAQVSAYTWTLKGNPGGSGQLVAESLQVIGADDGSTSQSGHTTWLEASTPVELDVTCTCQYQTTDNGGYDAPVYIVNGTPFVPQGTFDQLAFPTGAYLFSFHVPAGASFGLGIYTTDACCGVGIGQFVDLVAIPVNWTDLGGGLDPQPWFTTKTETDQADSLCGLGDVDGDGVGELVVDSHGDVVSVYSGATGARLFALPEPGALTGQVADAGDVNADGIPDFVLGLPQANGLAGRVEVRSGADGHLVFAFVGPSGGGAEFGTGVAGLGDVNGDGYDDVAAGSPFALSGHGEVVVLGGPDGQLLHDLSGPGGTEQFGRHVAALDDVDLDGVRDLAVTQQGQFATKVIVFSGATAAQLSVSTESQVNSGLNTSSIESAHDFDGDGRGDIAWWLNPATLTGGKITIHSGATGAELWSWQQSAKSDGAYSRVTVGDVNADGHDDVAFTVGMKIDVYSGAGTHALLDQIDPPGGTNGVIVSAFGDVDLDGTVDLAISPWDGQVQVLHALDGKGLPNLHGAGNLTGGSQVTLAIKNAKASAPFTLVIGASYLGAHFKGGTFVPQPLLLLPGVTSTDGRAAFSATWPTGLVGPIFFWSQAWIVDPAGPFGLSASNGLLGSAP